MSADPARAPSIDQLVEVHQALWWFFELNRNSWNVASAQEEQVLPGFERLADALADIRLDSINGWPSKIGRAIFDIVKAFDETTRLWGWEWISKPKSERSDYLKERRTSLDRTLGEPILEAALFMADRSDEARPCPYDDLADKARSRGLVPRSMTVEEALAQFSEARTRFSREPRIGKCYPKIGAKEYEAFTQGFQTLRSVLLGITPDRVERPPWQEQPVSASPAPSEPSVCPPWALSPSDVSLSMHDRNRPFPDRLDNFLAAFDLFEVWNSHARKVASHCADCRRKYHDFLEVYTTRLVATPGFERLLILAQREFGADLNSSTLRRFRGRIGRGNVTLCEAADITEKLYGVPVNPAAFIPEADSRSLGQRPVAAAETAASQPATENPPPLGLPETDAAKKPKRSTEPGEGRAKLISALTEHHKYADGGCLNLEPIGNNELAREADVSTSTASVFFNSEFEGHTKYKALCRDAGRLADALKVLNGEFSPHNLYGRRPADEDDRDDE